MRFVTPDPNAAPLRTQAWRKAVLVIEVAVGTGLVLAIWLQSALGASKLAWDFPVFYIAAKMPLRLLYRPEAFAASWQAHLGLLRVPHWNPYTNPDPYLRPAFFALLLRPIGMLAYWNAFVTWVGVGLCAYLASIGILMRRFRLPAFMLPIYAAFFPAMVGLIGGQDACVFLLVLLGAWLLLEARFDWTAGGMLALCLFKFNLVLLIPFLLLIKRRFQALTAFVSGAMVLAGCSALLASPSEYLGILMNGPKMVPGFYPVGLRGFSVSIGQPWCYPGLAILTFFLCCWLMKESPFTEAFCIAIVGTLLISPYVNWYDSTLLVLPLAVVFARSTMPMRIACVFGIVAWPLWRYGGGNNGPIGFTHVAVELFLLGYFSRDALRRAITSGNAKTGLRVAEV